jgi:tetratricopeptide (TPR) repeat protein
VREGADAETRAVYWLLVFLEGWHAVRVDPAFAIPRLQAGLEGQRHTGDAWALALSLAGTGFVRLFAGDYGGAQAALDEGYTIAEVHGYAWLRSMLLVLRGVLEALRSDPETARQHLHRALIAARGVGDPRHVSLTLSYLGLAALSLGQYTEVERVCREALAIAQEHQDRFQTCQALQSLGRVAVARGAYADGEALLDEGLAIAREINDRWLEAQALGFLAQLAIATGNHAEARTLQLAAVQAAAAAPQPIALDELTALAELQLTIQPDAALTVLAYVRQHPLSRPAARKRAERYWRDIWRQLPADRCLAAEAAMRSFPQDQPTALLALFS